MSIVYITDQGSSLYKRNERLYVKKKGENIRWFHTKDIEQLILMGNIAITSQVITFLLKERIDTVFLSYYGKYKGRLVGEFGKNIYLRVKQFEKFGQDEIKLELSKRYLCGKVANSLKVLRKYRYQDQNEELGKLVIKIKSYLKYDLIQSSSLDQLRGYEGIIAKEYFSAFKLLIKNPDFVFNGRNRRPPQDEINALLSLNYTLLMNQVLSKAYIAGLDPYYGVLHEIDYSRQSLALDIMEEFRPFVDNLVIKMINKRIMRKEHFTYNVLLNDDDSDESNSKTLPVALSPEGMKKNIFAFSEMMKKKYYYPDKKGQYSLSDIIGMQIYKLVDFCREDKEYKSFLWDDVE
jgi:CRISPR-associated protein Cas1